MVKKHNEILKPLKELREYPDNCKHLCRLVVSGVEYDTAYRSCFGAGSDNLSDSICMRRGKEIYNHPKLKKFLFSLNKEANEVTIKQVATTKAQFVRETLELKSLAMLRQDSKGRVVPDIKTALVAHKMIGEAQGFFVHAVEVNHNIRSFLENASDMKTVEKAVVEEIDQISSLPYFTEFKEI